MVAVQLFTWKPLILPSRRDQFASFNRSLSLHSLPLVGIKSFSCRGTFKVKSQRTGDTEPPNKNFGLLKDFNSKFYKYWFLSRHITATLLSKTRGMGAGRKLKRLRINQRWADKQYKKSHLGNEWKKPSTSCCHAKGIVLEIIGNSSIRVQLKNGKTVTAFVPNNDCLKYIVENDEVLIGGFGFPGVRLKVLTVSCVPLLALFKEKK